MSAQTAWFYVLTVGAVLYGFWRLLGFTFDVIEKAWAARSVSPEDPSSNKGTGL